MPFQQLLLCSTSYWLLTAIFSHSFENNLHCGYSRNRCMMSLFVLKNDLKGNIVVHVVFKQIEILDEIVVRMS